MYPKTPYTDISTDALRARLAELKARRSQDVAFAILKKSKTGKTREPKVEMTADMKEAFKKWLTDKEEKK